MNWINKIKNNYKNEFQNFFLFHLVISIASFFIYIGNLLLFIFWVKSHFLYLSAIPLESIALLIHWMWLRVWFLFFIQVRLLLAFTSRFYGFIIRHLALFGLIWITYSITKTIKPLDSLLSHQGVFLDEFMNIDFLFLVVISWFYFIEDIRLILFSLMNRKPIM